MPRRVSAASVASLDGSSSIPLHACSKEEIEVCAILSLGLNGPSYELFRAGHSVRLPGLPSPDFVHGTVIYQYDGMAFHGEDREERDVRVTSRHIAAGYTVVRLRDRVRDLPAMDGLTCVQVNARDKLRSAIYDLARVTRVPQSVAIIQEWSARRLSELVDVPVSRQPGIAWFQSLDPAPLLLKHYRMPFENAEFMTHLSAVCNALPAAACRSVVDRYDLERDVVAMHSWLLRLGVERFVTFAGKDSVATRLENPAFSEVLEGWLVRLGLERFVTFAGKDSVASRLDNPAFNEVLEGWLVRLGLERFVTFAGNNSVASRLDNPAFNEVL